MPGFGKLPNEFAEELPTLNAAAVKLAVYLCLRADGRDHRVKIETLIDRLGVGRTAVRAAIDELTKRGWISRKYTGRAMIMRWFDVPADGAMIATATIRQSPQRSSDDRPTD